MEKAKLSVIQMFTIMMIFELGTAVVLSYGIEAKKDVWLAVLIGLGGGILLFFIYYLLFRQYPRLPLTGYARKIFGKYIGWGIGLAYVILFLYISARNIREFGELILSSTLTKTPLLAVIILLVLAICYIVYLGIEVLGRTAEVLFGILLLLGVTGNLFVYLSGNVKLHHLRPILENGWEPIFTAAFPHILVFPFGEMIVFTMLLPYLNRPKLVKKVGLSALILSGLIISYTASLNIAVLSVEVVGRSTFPLLSTIGKVNLFEFIQRLDAIVVFTLLITVFFKASIYLYAAIIGIVDLFKLKSHHPMVLPVGLILIYFSLVISSNFSEQTNEGHPFLNIYILIPTMVILPLLMLIVSILRKKFFKIGNK